MNQEWTALMMDSISEVLSTMFFSPIEFDNDSGSDEVISFFRDKNSVIGRISAQGEETIYLYGCLNKDALEELTRDFTGKADVTDADNEGTLKELLNMICGGLLAEYYGDSDYRLKIPEIISSENFVKEKIDRGESLFLKGILLTGDIAFISVQRKES